MSCRYIAYIDILSPDGTTARPACRARTFSSAERAVKAADKSIFAARNEHGIGVAIRAQVYVRESDDGTHPMPYRECIATYETTGDSCDERWKFPDIATQRAYEHATQGMLDCWIRESRSCPAPA